MLDVTRTRDKNAYFVFTLELMLSLTPVIYQRDVRDVSNETTERELERKKKQMSKNKIILFSVSTNDIIL
jgi:hypothetical protein